MRIPFTDYAIVHRKQITIVPPSLSQTLQGVDDRNSWWRVVESFSGAWQSNTVVSLQNVLTYSPVFACVRLISSDIAKMRCRLVERDPSGVWIETESPAFSPFLRKPNRYQTRIKFFQQWMIAKLIHGNSYIIKQRDARNIVVAGYVLDPTRCRALVADDGSVYYELRPDNLSSLPEAVVVPANEIIHDTYLPLYHPLVGISPISACGIAAIEALRIQEQSATFFGNGSLPGGVITAPGHMDLESARRVKAAWDEGFTGENAGRVAVLSDGMKYEGMTVNATDAQLIEQLKWTAEDVCQAFGVPPYKVNVGTPPNLAGNVQALDLQYYSQCLQELIENVEELLDFGLGLAPDLIDGRRLGTEFNRDDLIQMDTAGRVTAATATVSGGVLSPNEARRRFMDAVPVKGGDSPMLQQQQFSLEALAERDAADPFSKPEPAPPALPSIAPPDVEDDVALEDDDEAVAASVGMLLQKAIATLDPIPI